MWTLNSEISVETKSKCMRASSGLCKHTYSEVSYILYTVYSKGGRNSDQIVGFCPPGRKLAVLFFLLSLLHIKNHCKRFLHKFNRLEIYILILIYLFNAVRLFKLKNYIHVPTHFSKSFLYF